MSDDVRVAYRQQMIPLEGQLWLVTAGIGTGSKAEVSGPHRAVALLANLREITGAATYEGKDWRPPVNMHQWAAEGPQTWVLLPWAPTENHAGWVKVGDHRELTAAYWSSEEAANAALEMDRYRTDRRAQTGSAELPKSRDDDND